EAASNSREWLWDVRASLAPLFTGCTWRLTVVPFMAVIYHRHFMHASGVVRFFQATPQTDKAASSIAEENTTCFVGLRRSLVSVAFHNYGYLWFGRAAFPSSQRRMRHQ